MTLVLVDLDGTLLDRKGSEVSFALALLGRGILGPRQIVAYLGFYLRWTWRFGCAVAKKNKAYLSGLCYEDVARLGAQFAHQHLLPQVRPTLLGKLESHRRLGYHRVLLTGSPDFLARPLAEILGIEHVRATRCAQRDGCFTAEPPLIHPFGVEKLRVAQEVAKKLNADLSDCIAYADSWDDLPLLLSVSHPVAVVPNAVLQRLSRRRGWGVF